MTCIPWNPVAKKKVEPYVESENENWALKYSNPWKNVNIIPKIIVKRIEPIANSIFFSKNEWWDQVIVAPDDNKIIEFNSGIPIGSNTIILIGGHTSPSSMFGEILLWKKAQKNLKKNMISDKINIIILNFSNFIVVNEWCPSKEDSRFTSRHHRNVLIIINEINRIII